MSVRSYGSYRDSGVEWLGAVPSHWVVTPLYGVAIQCDQPNVGMIEVNLLSLSYGAIVQKNIDSNDGLLPESFETYQIVEPDDIVWRLTDLQNDKRSLRTAIVTQRGIITFAYLATRPKGISPIYLSYLLRAYDLRKVFYSMGGGLRQSMKFSDVKRLPITLPPRNEQSAIVAFLDRETGKIDALVEEQRRLIELLKEKRQAVISHAVTKGLDPSAPMKDSGVEWLGEVPAHWEAVKLCRLTRQIVDGAHFTPTYVDEGVPFLRVTDITRRSIDLDEVRRIPLAEHIKLTKRCRPQKGDLLLSKNGTIGIPEIVTWDWDFSIFVSLCLIKLTNRLDARFAKYVFLSKAIELQINDGTKESTVSNLHLEKISGFRFPVPPLVEQVAISAELDRRMSGFETLISEAEAAITLLQERRAALISAAVTGKIDVRGWTDADVRRAVTAEIVYLNARDRTFGRVKNQKLIYLAEAYAGIHEIGGRYQRHAAGPYDGELMAFVERELVGAGVVTVRQDTRGAAVDYALTPGWKPDRERLKAMLGDRLAAFEHANEKLADLDTRGAEAVATLYAVWNDTLIDGEDCDDARVIQGFLHEWHPEKAEKFKEADLREWLGWMRRNGLTPQGRGPKTEAECLFK